MLPLALVVSVTAGIKLEVDTDLVVPDASKTLHEERWHLGILSHPTTIQTC